MKKLREYLLITLGSAIMGLSLNMFLIPNKVAAGGVSGIATVLEYTLNASPGIVVALVNTPLFLLAFLMLGDKVLIKSLYGTAVLSLSLEYLTMFGTITYDPLLACVAGGVLLGLGLGIVIASDATTGGTEIVARLINKVMPHFSVGRLILIVDSVIILWAGIAFESVDQMIYGAIALFISSNIVDNIVEGMDFAKNITIISKKSPEIAKAIISQMERGVTGLKSIGMYSGQEGTVLMCLIRRNELRKIKQIVSSYDKDAFVTLTDVREVIGEGFKINR